MRPGSEEWLIESDGGRRGHPGTALTEGITWGWETYPEYLDVIEKHQFAIDVGSQIAHGAVRAYAMGERGARNEPATPDDIAAMAAWFARRSRRARLDSPRHGPIAHRAMDGEPVPGTYAAEDECSASAGPWRPAGRPSSSWPRRAPPARTSSRPKKELEWMQRLGAEIDRPLSFAMIQVDAARTCGASSSTSRGSAHAAGVSCTRRSRRGLSACCSVSPAITRFTHRPTFRRLKAECSPEELATGSPNPRQGGDPVRGRPTADPSCCSTACSRSSAFTRTGSMRWAIRPTTSRHRTGPSTAIAAERGDDPLPPCTTSCSSPTQADADAAVLQLRRRQPRRNQGDVDPPGGSARAVRRRCTLQPDLRRLLPHLPADPLGPRPPPWREAALEYLVRKQSRDTAHLFGLTDRGTIELGKKADINVIDMNALRLLPARMAYDLPAGGQRLVQGASGYSATIVSGAVTRRDGVDTGARPGRLVRGPR